MFGNVCSLTSHWHVFVPFDFNHESLSRCEGGRQMMWCFLDHVLYNYHSCFVMLFCFCTFLHIIYLVFLLKILSSRVILRKQQGVRESQSGLCCSAVFDFWPLPWCIDPCAAPFIVFREYEHTFGFVPVHTERATAHKSHRSFILLLRSQWNF